MGPEEMMGKLVLARAVLEQKGLLLPKLQETIDAQIAELRTAYVDAMENETEAMQVPEPKQWVNVQRVDLGPKEARLMTYFSEHPNQVIEYQAIAQLFWERKKPRGYKVQISGMVSALREKILHVGRIKTVSGRGYIFIPTVSESIVIEPRNGASPIEAMLSQAEQRVFALFQQKQDDEVVTLQEMQAALDSDSSSYSSMILTRIKKKIRQFGMNIQNVYGEGWRLQQPEK